MTLESDLYLLLLQLSDSALPIGAFSHSFGLESFVQDGFIKDSESAFEFLQCYILEPFLYNDLLAIKYAYQCKDLNDILELEHILFVQTLAREIREANIKLGKRFIKIAKEILFKKGISNEFWNLYTNASINPTHASAFGMLCSSVGIDFKVALKHYAYTQVSNMVVNAVKLIPLAQDSGQGILARLHDSIQLALYRLETLDECVDDRNCNDFFSKNDSSVDRQSSYNQTKISIATSCDPSSKETFKSLRFAMLGICSIHYDISTMCHEVLYSRLYMS